MYIGADSRGMQIRDSAFATQVSITNIGNLGLGETSAAYKLRIKTDATLENGMYVSAGDSSSNHAVYVENEAGTAEHFAVRGDGEIRLNASTIGQVLIGNTTSIWGNEALAVYKTSAEGIAVTTNDINHAAILSKSYVASTSAHYVLYITKSNSANVGSITHDDTNTSFNTSSDYRLKEDLKDFSGLDTLSKIKMYDFKWKDTNQRQQGVIAHELEEIMPYAVTGKKDGTRIYKGKELPDYQGVDYAKLVPLLVKSVQELKAEIDELKNK